LDSACASLQALDRVENSEVFLWAVLLVEVRMAPIDDPRRTDSMCRVQADGECPTWARLCLPVLCRPTFNFRNFRKL